MFSSPESHSSIHAQAVGGEGSTKAGLSVEEDASYSPLPMREDFRTTPDIQPQLQSPHPLADVVIDGPSTHPLGTEHIGHHSLDPAHYQYDIV